MFNLQGSEIIFILLLALVVLGPEKLPGAIRRFTRTYAELRKMGTSFQQEVKTAFDEPMREVRETADLIKQQVDVDALEAAEDETPDASGAAEPTGSEHDAVVADDPLSPPVAGTARPGPGRPAETGDDPDTAPMPPPPPASPSPPPSAIPTPPPPFSSANGMPRADLPAPDANDGVSDEQRGAPSP